MRENNQSSTLEFILLGVTGQQEQEDFFYILFLFIYPITLIGNLLIILAICSDVRLHNPMYFFLSNLSLVDIFFSSVTIPKMLANHLLGSKSISFGGCLTQMYFMIALGNTDSYILAAMAYDRAVAISRPLHYTTIMSPRSCVLLVVGSWVIGNANGLPHTLLTASLSFCGNQEVANFYCDITPLLKLSCSDIRFNVKMMYVGVGVFSVPLLCIIVSYVQVFSTVFQVPSTKGVLKAFSTCGSHLTVVSLYYGTVMGMYFRPLTNYSLKDAVITVMYMAVTPMLNPFIYSLRNRDMKAALRKLFNKRISSQPM
ncbi:PREDICTED: olfactory receptor 1A1 [Mandrillus leucophaeus]|uniref:G-protein coupled receptors family 1 profile domain-containing protein n=1 Tax=Mandrillus leucophaeus TaxID=9568 RepID=A0A2K5XSL2_MANLE|nr:PREDICTED: olfactory receptor 1A1 [Mandrillus leucophaeus]XP_011856612.1 PREDICTED: olfactory receptor 1A1 [Mandrillus leucophaeus]